MDDKRKQYVTELKEIMFRSYKETLNVPKNMDKIEDQLLIEQSTYNRLHFNIIDMKADYIFDKTNYISTLFRGERDNSVSIYGYLYSKQKGQSFENEYYCFGGAFISQDGEYRRKFLPFEHLEESLIAYAKEFDKVESLLLQKMEQGNIKLYADMFYPKDFEGSQSKFEEFINKERIAIKLLMLCWFSDYHTIYHGVIENHINPAYQHLIFDEEDDDVYQEIFGLIGTYSDYLFAIKFFQYNSPASKLGKTGSVRTGQKIFPLTKNAIANIYDINSPVWKEMLISTLCADLLVNLISPSFSFINDWFLIQNIHPGFFDNVSQYEKFEQSKIGEEIREQLQIVDQLNYVKKPSARGAMIPINSKFQKMSNKTRGVINYAESNVILTDIAININSEYVGLPIRDAPAHIEKLGKTNPMHRFSSDYKFFAKIMFDYVYALYCANYHIGIMHGDLHVNNSSLYHFFYLKDELVEKEPKTIYILDEEKTYIFDHISFYGVLIDFSRSILGKKSIVENIYDELYADVFFKGQRDRIMRLLNTHFPTFVSKHKETLMSILLDNFELFFKVISVIDTMTLMTGVHHMLKEEKKIAIRKESLDLAERLSRISRALVVQGLEKLINKEIKSADDIEFPNKVILKEVFGDFEYKKGDLGEHPLLDIFNATNEVKYHAGNYFEYPRFMRLEEAIALKKKFGMPTEREEKIIKRIAEDKDTKLDFLKDLYTATKVSFESSWMFEGGDDEAVYEIEEEM